MVPMFFLTPMTRKVAWISTNNAIVPNAGLRKNMGTIEHVLHLIGNTSGGYMVLYRVSLHNNGLRCQSFHKHNQSGWQKNANDGLVAWIGPKNNATNHTLIDK